MSTIQELIAKAHVGSTLDLGSVTYTGDRYPLHVSKPLTIIGHGAVGIVPPSSVRDRPALVVSGPGVRLLGNMTLSHELLPQNDLLEAQHGIEFQGATAPECTWSVLNAQGSSYYVGKDFDKAPGTGWTTDLYLHDAQSKNSGRQHVALQAVKGFRVHAMVLDTVGAGHSAIVFEPNGHDWGCQDGLIDKVTFRGPTNWCFGALGLGDHQPSHGNLAFVTMSGCWSQDTPLSIRIAHGIGNRRGPFTADKCGSDTIAHRPTVFCRGVDDLTVTRYVQPKSAGVSLWDIDDCTKVSHD